MKAEVKKRNQNVANEEIQTLRVGLTGHSTLDVNRSFSNALEEITKLKVQVGAVSGKNKELEIDIVVQRNNVLLRKLTNE